MPSSGVSTRLGNMWVLFDGLCNPDKLDGDGLREWLVETPELGSVTTPTTLS